MEGKVLSDPVTVTLDCQGNSGNYGNLWVDWLLLTVLESL